MMMMIEDISSELWKILDNLIGSREQVFIRQKHYALIDKITGEKKYELIYSGSIGEGLNLKGSDVDIMIINKNIQVKPLHFENESNCDLIMESANLKPGFTKLSLPTRRNRGKVKLPLYLAALTEVNDRLYLSSLLYRDRYVDLLQNIYELRVQPHGPCGTMKRDNNEYDIMECFSCKIWPNVANEWIHRHRTSNWPPRDLVVDIVSDGCLLVPVGNPLSDECHMEWRISFSLAEKKLVHSMNHTQILCYGLLKLFLKHVIDSRDVCTGLLCSYFLKTALFYCIEEENIEWEKHNFLPCFMACLRRLLFWVREGYCPNYFIKTNNMFESKIVGEKQIQLQGYLFSLYENGLDSLMRIPIFFNMRSNVFSSQCQIPSQGNSANEYRCDVDVLQIPLKSFCKNIEEVIVGMGRIQRELLQANINQVDRMLLMIQDFAYRSMFVQYRYQLISSSDISNRIRYTQLRSLSKYIVDKCLKGDICRGWILYATLCYLTGKNNKVISTVEYILTKFKSFVFYKGPTQSPVKRIEYIKHVCGKGFTMHQKLKLALARTYIAVHSCEFYPEEIRSEINQHRYKYYPFTYVPPKFYCHVLLFLVYNKTGQMELRDKTLNRLCTVVEKREFITEYEIPLALALVQKCFELASC